jgi:hypothetical protein
MPRPGDANRRIVCPCFKPWHSEWSATFSFDPDHGVTHALPASLLGRAQPGLSRRSPRLEPRPRVGHPRCHSLDHQPRGRGHEPRRAGGRVCRDRGGRRSLQGDRRLRGARAGGGAARRSRVALPVHGGPQPYRRRPLPAGGGLFAPGDRVPPVEPCAGRDLLCPPGAQRDRGPAVPGRDLEPLLQPIGRDQDALQSRHRIRILQTLIAPERS